MKRIAVSLFLALLLSACQTQGDIRRISDDGTVEPIRPGMTRVKFKNHDTDHWIGSRKDDYTVMTCRPLGCPANTVVYMKNFPSTRNPDQTAVMNMAQKWVDSEIEKGSTITVKPQLGRYKNFPAVSFAWSHVKNENTIYDYRKVVFAGGLAISLQAASLDKAYSPKAVDHFLAMIEIEDGGSLK